jgi:hypothetical protein
MQMHAWPGPAALHHPTDGTTVIDPELLTHARAFATAVSPSSDAAFLQACADLFVHIDNLRPSDTDRQWLIRPDFDWSEPLESAEHALGGAHTMLLFASSRYLQAMQLNAPEQSSAMRTSMNLIKGAETLERMADAARAVARFCQEWTLPPESVEDLAYFYAYGTTSTR